MQLIELVDQLSKAGDAPAEPGEAGGGEGVAGVQCAQRELEAIDAAIAGLVDVDVFGVHSEPAEFDHGSPQVGRVGAGSGIADRLGRAAARAGGGLVDQGHGVAVVDLDGRRR